jgi:two-component system chemotaxis response regulator CheB
MRILALDPRNRLKETLAQAARLGDDVEIVGPPSASIHPSVEHGVDVIVADGLQMSDPTFRDELLQWRTHPDTLMAPGWISGSPMLFRDCCLWPPLSIDVFQELLDPRAFIHWMIEVHEWQQSRMMVEERGSLASRPPLELVRALSLRKATGTLRVTDRQGTEGMLRLQGGGLVEARIRDLPGGEGFFDFFCWSEGSYAWEGGVPADRGITPQPLASLTAEALRLLRDANLIFHFVSDLDRRIARTSSESALDDGAAAHFHAITRIYSMIDGRRSIAAILERSPLSLPRTLSCLAKWLSLGDIVAEPDTESPGRSCGVLIVDDSPFMCKAISSALSRDPRITVLGEAHDGDEALQLIETLSPDVVTLDLQMPRMDGLTALKHIMIRHPRPVIVLSAFTPRTSPLTYQSFKLGAVDVVAKPSRGSSSALSLEEDLCRRVQEAAAMRIEAAQVIRSRKHGSDAVGIGSTPSAPKRGKPADHVVLLLCGAGGFPGLVRLLLSIGRSDIPFAILACLDMPAAVLHALRPNIEKDAALAIAPLEADRVMRAGECCLGSRQQGWTLYRNPQGIKVRSETTDSKLRRPFDLLLQSAKTCCGSDAVALMLSGDGTDGILGMKEIREAGGRAYVLAPHACLKPDLPRSVLESSGAGEIGSTAEMAALLEHIQWSGHQQPFPSGEE